MATEGHICSINSSKLQKWLDPMTAWLQSKALPITLNSRCEHTAEEELSYKRGRKNIHPTFCISHTWMKKPLYHALLLKRQSVKLVMTVFVRQLPSGRRGESWAIGFAFIISLVSPVFREVMHVDRPYCQGVPHQEPHHLLWSFIKRRPRLREWYRDVIHQVRLLVLL